MSFIWVGMLLYGCNPTEMYPMLPTFISPTVSIPIPLTPTVIPAIPQENWTFIASNNVLPEGVLQEVVYFGGGGGGDSSFCSDEKTPTILDIDTTQQMMRYGYLLIFSCGWNVGEVINIEIIRPDGIVIVKNQEVEVQKDFSPNVSAEYGPVNVVLLTGVHDPHGNYRVLFLRNGKTILQAVRHVIPPEYPTMSYSYYFNQFDQKDYLELIGYAPLESVNLFEYDCRDKTVKCRFVAWQYIVVDQLGQAIVSIPPEQSLFDFVAIGDLSGIAWNSRTGIGIPIHCGSGLPSRLALALEINISNDVYMYDSPNGSQVILMSKNTDWYIIDGPICKGNFMWWKMQSADNPLIIGWTIESSDSEYYLK